MAWSAEIISGAQFNNGVVRVPVQFTDGDQTFAESFDSIAFSVAWLQESVRDRLGRLDAMAAEFKRIEPGPIVLPSEAPDLVSAFNVAYSAWKHQEELISNGIAKPGSADVLLAAAKDAAIAAGVTV